MNDFLNIDEWLAKQTASPNKITSVFLNAKDYSLKKQDIQFLEEKYTCEILLDWSDTDIKNMIISEVPLDDYDLYE